MNLSLLRILLALLLTGACLALEPFGLGRALSALLGAVCAGAAIAMEARVRAMPLGRLIGASVGCVLGVFAAFLFCMVLRGSLAAGPTQEWLQVLVLMGTVYIGAVVGASKGGLLKMEALQGLFHVETSPRGAIKLLDTSAIIDGRIADMAETGFLDGPLAVPEFVLAELQLVADSADGGKRQRGRRGLDVLQRMKQSPGVGIQILDEDVPGLRAVDLKLIELGKRHGAKIVTTDFNLNKLAQVHGVTVLNINDLTNALKPVVLPGEKMSLFILKEGKELNQGIGYLDDGTMVVVDHARKHIGKSVEISVTSVLQTPSGKMIFGKSDGGNGHGTAGGFARPEEQGAQAEALRSESIRRESLRPVESHAARPIVG